MTRTLTRTFTVAALAAIVTFLSSAVQPAFAGEAPNLCDWVGPWAAAGPMTSKRDGATATTLSDGRVLFVGGWDGSNTIAFAEIYDPATGVFSMTGSLATARASHVATLLQDGRVLIAGGINIANGAFTARLKTAEIYNPATGSFSAAASMSTDRQDGAAVLLANGKVLVTGGFGSTPFGYSTWLQTAEIFDPATGAFSVTGSMATGRGIHRATRLNNGKVLVTGGTNSAGTTNTAEVFDPNTGAFSATATTMTSPRQYHTATLLPSGVVVLTGGTNGATFLSSTETYDPASNRFAAGISLLAARQAHTAILLPIGKLMIVGGETAAGAINAVEISSSGGGGFEAMPALPEARAGHTVSLLPNGSVLFAGGRNASGKLASAVIYDPLFRATGKMTSTRVYHTATRLVTGQVLIVGGMQVNTPVATAELYDPATGTFTATGSMASPRYAHTATELPGGQILITGGFSAFNSSPLASAEIYNPFTGTFVSAAPMSMPRSNHTATLLPTGTVLVAGGTTSTSAELYHIGTNTWSSTGPMTFDRTGHTATLLFTGQVLVAGGWSTIDGGITFTTELYDPATGTFTSQPQPKRLWTNREYHVATVLADGRVLMTGGLTSGITPTKKAEIYDPSSGFFSPAGDMTVAHYRHAAVLTNAPGDKVMVVGGQSAFNSNTLASAELYDPSTNAFSLTGPMQLVRYNPTATLLLDSRVLVAGGAGDYGGDQAVAEISKPTHCGPMITGLTPSAGPVGMSVTISGSQFGGLQSGSTVTFNGMAANVVSWSDTSIVVTVPVGATTGPVVVTVGGRASNNPTFTVTALPDLVVQSIVANPPIAVQGQSVTITVTVLNQGSAAAGAFYTDIYKNLSSAPGGLYGDVSCWNAAGLAAGATITCTATFVYSSSGTYYLWAQVDLDAIVNEQNEGNNVVGPQSLSVVASAGPDLVVKQVKNSSSATRGGTMLANEQVANIGSSAAGASTTRFYLSTDPVKDPGDLLLIGSHAVPALASAASASGQSELTLPSRMMIGNYYLIACTDDLNAVGETIETNNCFTSKTGVRVQ